VTVTLPELAGPDALRVPEWVERTLPNGLTVIALRRSAVPLVELRLRVPFGRTPLTGSQVLAETLLSGTATMTNVEIDARLQAIGGGLGVSTDQDRLLVSGSALVAGLERLLGVLAEVLTGATYPASEVATERDRLADRIQVARHQPSHLAREALLRRIFPGHPYEVQTPEPEQVRATGREALDELHRARVRPNGAVLVLVGDLDPEVALDLAGAAVGRWERGGEPPELPPIPPLAPAPLALRDRPGSVQSSLRLALPAVDRSHPDHAALQLANMVFGGYFSSRWMENIREEKGYSYGPRSSVEHGLAGSTLVVSADVGTEVTAPALLETWYELGRIASTPPGADEVAQARQYLLGSLQLAIATQSGLASLAATYAGFGLRMDYLGLYAERLRAATVEQVAAAGASYLAPAGLAGVVLGDADRVEPGLARLTAVVRDPGPDTRR
jgi:zinc protease